MVGTPLVDGRSSMGTQPASLRDGAAAWDEAVNGARQTNAGIAALTGADDGMAGADGPPQSAPAAGKASTPAQQTALEFMNSEEVSKITKLSPTLTNALKTLQDDKWTIRWAKDKEQGTFSINSQKLIVLDPASARDAKQFVSSLAHEVGHAKYDGKYPKDANAPLPARDEFIQNYVDTYLRHEGEATLTQLQIHDEILSAGGPELPFEPGRSKAYQIMYRGFKNGRTREQQATAIGRFFGDNERPSNEPERSYRAYYERLGGEQFDHLEKRQKQNIATPKKPDVSSVT